MFWPGPLTLVLPKKACIPKTVSGGLSTIGIRMPDNIIALALIAESGIPLAAPSANLSGGPSPTEAQHVVDDMWGRIDLILDGGPTTLGVESTVLDLTEDPPSILRPGSITLEQLQTVIGDVKVDAKVSSETQSFVNAAQGGIHLETECPNYFLNMKAVLVIGEAKAVMNHIQKEAKIHRNRGEKVGILSSEENKEQYLNYADVVTSIGSRYDMTQVAANLYGVFRSFNSCKVDILFIEGFKEEGLGFAVMNRLKRASGGQIIHI